MRGETTRKGICKECGHVVRNIALDGLCLSCSVKVDPVVSIRKSQLSKVTEEQAMAVELLKEWSDYSTIVTDRQHRIWNRTADFLSSLTENKS